MNSTGWFFATHPGYWNVTVSASGISGTGVIRVVPSDATTSQLRIIPSPDYFTAGEIYELTCFRTDNLGYSGTITPSISNFSVTSGSLSQDDGRVFWTPMTEVFQDITVTDFDITSTQTVLVNHGTAIDTKIKLYPPVISAGQQSSLSVFAVDLAGNEWPINATITTAVGNSSALTHYETWSSLVPDSTGFWRFESTWYDYTTDIRFDSSIQFEVGFGRLSQITLDGQGMEIPVDIAFDLNPKFFDSYGNHLEVVGKVFNFLRETPGKITNKFMKQQLSILDKLDGNVDSVSNRIANVRTWSYVANKNGWVENQDYWVERTKFLEDRLSDRLHEELTKSFIDKRASVLAKGLKQDIIFETKIVDNEKVMINNQFIGNLKGLKLELDFKIGDLDSDIKSLKKASRQNVGPEIVERINQIIITKNIELKKDLKIYWNNFPIAYLVKGNDYLKPEINVIVDDVVENEHKNVLQNFLKTWLNNKINIELGSLIKLKDIKSSNSSTRALSYMLYENNGVLKRDNIDKLLRNIDQKERKILRDQGVKFGRYHIFLYKLFKPNIVSLRLILWKSYNEKYYDLEPPTFGLSLIHI